MNTIDDIKEKLETEVKEVKPEEPKKVNAPLTLTPALIQEIRDLRVSVEAILIFLKITDRMTEAQYRFTFGHVKENMPKKDENIDDFLTRSAIELEKKMKNMGLLKSL